MKLRTFTKFLALFAVLASLVACASFKSTVSQDASKSLEGNAESDVVTSVLDRIRPVYDQYRKDHPDAAGEMTVRLALGSSGDVDSVRIVKSNLDDPELENAIKEDLTQWKYDVSGIKSFVVETTVSFSAEGVACAKNERSGKDILLVVETNKRERLRPIFNKHLQEQSGLGGKMRVKIVIVENGTVENVEILESTLGNPEFEQAVLEDILQWKFTSGNYDKSKVTIPLTFVE